MSKRFVALPVIAILVVLVAGFPAAASSNNYFDTADSASIDVFFPLSEGDVGTPPTQPEASGPSGTYTVIIPASLNLKYEQEFLFRAESVSIPSENRLSVYINGAQTFAADGKFYLYNGGTEENRRISCSVLRGGSQSNIGEAELINGPNDIFIAGFGNGDTLPHAYGRLFIQPGYSLQNIPGTYSGIMYFKIKIESADVLPE